MNGATAVTPSVSSVDTKQNKYAHLIPLQRRYAELSCDDPQRRRLREQLIRGYLPGAEHIARRFTSRGEPLDDLAQAATVGLIKAGDRFESTHGSNFLSFAVPTITGEVRRYFRDHGCGAPRTHHPRAAVLPPTNTDPNRRTGRHLTDARLPSAPPNARVITGAHVQRGLMHRYLGDC